MQYCSIRFQVSSGDHDIDDNIIWVVVLSNHEWLGREGLTAAAFRFKIHQ